MVMATGGDAWVRVWWIGFHYYSLVLQLLGGYTLKYCQRDKGETEDKWIINYVIVFALLILWYPSFFLSLASLALASWRISQVSFTHWFASVLQRWSTGNTELVLPWDNERIPSGHTSGNICVVWGRQYCICTNCQVVNWRKNLRYGCSRRATISAIMFVQCYSSWIWALHYLFTLCIVKHVYIESRQSIGRQIMGDAIPHD